MSFKEELKNLRSMKSKKESGDPDGGAESTEVTVDPVLVELADSIVSEVKNNLSQNAAAGGKGMLLTIVDVAISNDDPSYDPKAGDNPESTGSSGTVHLRTNRDLKQLYELLYVNAEEDGIMVELVSSSLLKERYSLRFSMPA